jgi:formate hydrogenlyase transcriptional activator
LVLSILVLVSPLFASNVYADAPTKRVLILTGYDPNSPAVAALNRAITTNLRQGSAGRVEFFYEFQENLRIPNAKYESEMVAYLRRKYESENIALAVALGAPAIKFLLAHEPEIFSTVPKLFYFHDESEATAKSLWPHVTGVWADIEFNKTLEIALATRPDTKNVVVVSGNSNQDKFLRDEAQTEFASYATRIQFTYLTDVTIDDLKQKLSVLPPNTVVIYLSFFVDKTGNAFSGPEALSRFAATTNAPVFGISETYMGAGMVGGSLLDFDALGRRVADVGLRLMAGAKAQDIPPETAPNVIAFDWRQLQKWGIDEGRLPQGSTIRFRVPTFWEMYYWYIIFAIAIVVVQAILIIGLLITRARRRSAELLVAQQHRRLNEVVSNVPGMVWETRVDPVTRQRKTTFVSQYVERMLGYPPEEWLKRTGFGLTLVHEDDRERVAQESEMIFERGTEGILQFRWIAKDGRAVWVAAHLAPIFGDDGKVVGLRGVTLDITEQRLAEDARRESEEKNRALLQAVPDLMFLQTLDGVYLDYHAQRPDDLFLGPQTFMGKNMREVLPPPLALEFSRAFQNTKVGETRVLEYMLPLNGSERWFEARMVRTGERILSVVRDITERKLALHELQNSEERFGKAFRSNPQPMSLTTVREGRYLDVNESFLHMSGYTREEVIGHTSIELNIWEMPDARRAFIDRLTEQGALVNLETKFRTRDGSFRTLLSSAEFLNIAGEECLIVASSDITERMAAQQALRESEARFRNMADTAPVMIWVSDASGVSTYFNKQWLDFTGNTMEAEIDNGWSKGIHLDDREFCRTTFAASFDQRKQFEMEYRLRRHDGEYRWILDSGTPRFSVEGSFMGFIGSCIDITERKESERELRKAHEELFELKNQLEAENIYLLGELEQGLTSEEIIGRSDAIKYILFNIAQVAPTDSTVLITGETGTGKELVARAIHDASLRKDKALIRVNCAALAPTLIESELFGYEKGAFTGAGARKLGRFDLANGGTIFLDEIGELPLELQVKLLRVIQENEFERLGGTQTIKTDVRIIAATNRDLKSEVAKGGFREDLWYRLNVYPIELPPLRRRMDDLPLLVEHFIKIYANKLGKTVRSISPRVMQRLQAHSWPGNIRELANVIERAVILTNGTVLQTIDTFERPEESSATTPQTLEDVERDHILKTLKNTGWRIEGPYGAAKVLGINASTLRTRMRKLGIQRGSSASAA